MRGSFKLQVASCEFQARNSQLGLRKNYEVRQLFIRKHLPGGNRRSRSRGHIVALADDPAVGATNDHGC